MEIAQAIIDKWVDEHNIEKPLILRNLNLSTLPVLPNNVKKLDCEFNKLSELPRLPNNLKELNCTYNELVKLPKLPERLKVLICSHNNLVKLPLLPNSIEKLDCQFNKLKELPKLPDTLKILLCSHNKLKKLPIIPESLTNLETYNNPLEGFYEIIDLGPMSDYEPMDEYINRIREMQDNNINSSQIKEVNSNARNYISLDDIKNGNVLVNLKRSNNKYNSNFKEFIKHNTWNTMLHKTKKHPLTRYIMNKNNIKYYTAKVKK